MYSKHAFFWLAMATFLSIPACGSGTPEDFCESWAADTCEAVAGCCGSKELFDVEGCRVGLSGSCQDKVEVEKVHAGELVFDSGAASDCFGPISSCEGLQGKPIKGSFERDMACANMLTGFRPLGAACEADNQCEKDGDFTVCLGGAGNGICASVVLDDAACGFSFENNELRVCPDGKRCDSSGSMPSSLDPPSTQKYIFSGTCVANSVMAIPQGGICGAEQPCAEGLYCDQISPEDAICKPSKQTGAPCFFADECAAGLTCNFESQSTPPSCQPTKVTGLFCFTPG